VIVAVDARNLGAGRGIARVTRSMLCGLARGFPDDEWRLVVPGREPVDTPARDNVVVVRSRAPSRVLHGTAAMLGRPRLAPLAVAGVDVAWVPAPAPVAVGDVPYVLTVHDLSWEDRPQDFTRYERLWHRAARPRSLAWRAARVAADSSATRDQLLARWGLEPERVRVVVNGVDPPPPAAQSPPPVGVPPRYVLFVGALEPRKAPELLVDGHALARARGLDADLVFVGAGRLAGRLTGHPGVHVLGAVDDRRLDALYRGALALVLPSWLEGYGLTPLEALARGTPAIVADLPVYDETVGGAALRFRPGDASSLADMLLRVERDRGRLLAATRPLPGWDEAAQKLRGLLAEAAG
jgi:glycosyltransferase involved in cell wall biosynthesis